MLETTTRRVLLSRGWTVKRIARAVHRGELIRLRRGHYATPAVPEDVQRAVHVGGRLACVSELRHRGIWVVDPPRTHVHVAPNAARLRDAEEVHLHWGALTEPARATASHVSLVDALIAAADCLDGWSAIATMESAVRQGRITIAELRSAVAGSPRRIRRLVAQVKATADSGLETLVRLLVEALGFRVTAQVTFAGIGVVDLVVEDWIVIETDGRHHDDAVVAPRDRRRDARHAAADRTALRFRYHQVVHDLPSVAAAIIGAVRSHRRVPNSGELARRAESRARRLGFA